MMSTVHTSSEAQQRMQRLRELLSSTGNPLIDGLTTAGKYIRTHPAVTQGSYYVICGMWPLLASAFSEAGAPARSWYAQAASLLLLVIGATLLVAAIRRQKPLEIWCLAVGSAAGIALLEIVLIAEGAISAKYLMDVLIEVGILFLWAVSWFEKAPEDAPVATPVTPAEPVQPSPSV
jgi:VIT1/CCC1 family predicted Fe2+/Mn2+ transporter